MSTAPQTPAAAPSVIQLNIKEKAALYAAYISAFTHGGIFIPSAKPHRLGEDLYILLTLPDDPQRYTVSGKVAWITPARASSGRSQGIGIRFPKDERASQLREKIERLLGPALGSEKATQTI